MQLGCFMPPQRCSGRVQVRSAKLSSHKHTAPFTMPALIAVDSLRKQVAVLKGQLSRDRVLRSMQA